MSTHGYQVEFSLEAERQFKALRKGLQRRIAPRIDALSQAPRPRGVEKVEGADDLYRLHVEGYRIIYQIREGALRILVLRVARLKSAASLLTRTREASLQLRRLRRRRTGRPPRA